MGERTNGQRVRGLLERAAATLREAGAELVRLEYEDALPPPPDEPTRAVVTCDDHGVLERILPRADALKVETAGRCPACGRALCPVRLERAPGAAATSWTARGRGELPAACAVCGALPVVGRHLCMTHYQAAKRRGTLGQWPRARGTK